MTTSDSTIQENASEKSLQGNSRPEGNCLSVVLSVTAASGRVKELSFPRLESLLIGSGSDAQLRLEDSSVGRLHLLLQAKDGSLRFQDLQSGKTTLVNGAAPGDCATLKEGDELRLGNIAIRVQRLAPPQDDPGEARIRPTLEARLLWGSTILECQRSPGPTFSPPPSSDFHLMWSGVAGQEAHPHLATFSQDGSSVLIHVPQGWKVLAGPCPSSSRPGVPGSTYGASGHGHSSAASTPAEEKAEDAGSATKEGTLRLEEGQFCAIEKSGLVLELTFDRAPTFAFHERRSPPGVLTISLLALLVLAGIFISHARNYTIDEGRLREEFYSNPQKLARWVAYVNPSEEKKAKALADAQALKKNARDESEKDIRKKPSRSDSDGDEKTAEDAPASEEQGDGSGAPGEAGKPGTKISRKKVMGAGILGALGKAGKNNGSVGGVFGGGGSFGQAIDNALGSVTGGSLPGSGDGTGPAFGLRGVSGDGAGLSLGGVGAGAGGPGGEGGDGGGGGSGGKGGGMRKPKPATRRPTVSGKSVMAGSCQKEEVGKVIARNSRHVLACYEAELVRSPSLEGKVTVQFTIGSDGKVSDFLVKESTLGSKAVEDCMAKRIRRWRFPQPQGGGICVVNYPWLFQQAGSGGGN